MAPGVNDHLQRGQKRRSQKIKEQGGGQKRK